MNKNFKFISGALALMLCFTAMAFGQRTSGNIDGTVTDPNGAVVPNATVTAKATGSTTGFSRTITADENGYFQFSQVPVGTYTVTATGTGFKTSRQDVVVTLDKSVNSNFKLEVGGGETVVDVLADSAVNIDLGDTKIDTNISKQVIDSLPKGTTFTSLLKTAPNVRPEALSGGFQIDGASGSENVFVIDGQEVTNFRTGVLNTNNNLPFELVQEVQIKSTGYEAEFGGATGGLINVVTSGGNDQWRGNFGISFEPSKLQGRPNPIVNRFSAALPIELFQPLKNGGTNFFPTASISGPVIKEKLWFSAIYAPQIFDVTQDVDFYRTTGSGVDVFGRPNTSSNPNSRTVNQRQQLTFKRKIEEAFFRLDAQPTSKLRLFGTFLYNPIIDQGATVAGNYGLSNFTTVGPLVSQGGVFRDQNEFLDNQGGRQNSNSLNAQATWNPTNWLIANFRIGRSFLNEKLASYGLPVETRTICATTFGIAPESVAPGAGCSLGFTNFPNNFQIDYDVSTRTTFDADASLVGINAFGRHNFKFGYQFNRLFNSVNDGYRNQGIVQLFYGVSIDDILGHPDAPPTQTTNCDGTIPDDPADIEYCGAGFIQRFATQGEATSTNHGLFAQDSWQIGNRVTLNLGVRIESEKVPAFNPGIGSNIEFGWGDKISPRLGIAVDVTGDGKTKAFANYGVFYDRFKYELPRGSFGGDFFRRDYFEILPSRGNFWGNYTLANILGNNQDVIGGTCPTTGTGWSACQLDFRIASNTIGGDIFNGGAVDPDMKAARQSEYTIGLERQLGQNFLISGRFTHKQVDEAIEDVGIPTPQGSEAYVIGNVGRGLSCEVLTEFGFPCAEAIRKYDALEIRLDKRATQYFFNASYTLSRLKGNYSGLASSDEGGRTSPNVNRFFDLPFLGFNADGEVDNGRLATDRPHVFKAFGGYTFDWGGSKSNSTEVSAFTTIQSGSPVTTFYQLFSVTSALLSERGDQGRTEMFTETDLAIRHRYKFGRDNKFVLEPYVNFRNLFDERNELTRQMLISSTNFSGTALTSAGCTTCGDEVETINTIFNGGISQYLNQLITPRNDYNLTNGWQLGREVRFGARFFF
jgi:hypothetical protein